MLMSPAPADDDELWWLATNNRLDVDGLRELLGAELAPE
jgi:hypothetical protein